MVYGERAERKRGAGGGAPLGAFADRAVEREGTAVLHHFTYVSSAASLFSGEQLARLLETSRVANERGAITGMLPYKDANFMQTVEGPEGAMADLRERLHEDPRHKGLLVLLSGTREERLFEDWSMGFQDLADADASALPGYSELLDSELTAEAFGDKPAASQRLLLTFRRKLR